MRGGKLIIVVAFMFFALSSYTQLDSVKTLSFEGYMNLVSQFHPVALEAKLQESYGDAEVLKARGGFDPKIQASSYQKSFNEKKYYSLLEGGVKIPTWYGVEFKSGYELNEGVYLNDQNRTPDGGLLYAGVSVSLGQGMFIDKRRAELKQAKIYRESTEAQRRQMLNDLLLEAGMAYWNWYQAFMKLNVLNNAVTVAKNRFISVKSAAMLGDKPAIDTVEAKIYVQNRTLLQQEAQLNYRNAMAYLSIYMWDKEMRPLEIMNIVEPEMGKEYNALIPDDDYLKMVDTLLINHPEYQQYAFKIDQLEVEKRLKKEQLKPQVNLQYNPITEYYGTSSLSSFNSENYTFGMSLSMPILLRKERGELQKTEIKIMEVSLSQSDKMAQLTYKAQASMNEWETTYNQVLLYKETLDNTRLMLEGEKQLFRGGESSLFMINTREMQYFKTELKLIDLLSKNRMAEVKTKYALGMLNE